MPVHLPPFFLGFVVVCSCSLRNLGIVHCLHLQLWSFLRKQFRVSYVGEGQHRHFRNPPPPFFQVCLSSRFIQEIVVPGPGSPEIEQICSLLVKCTASRFGKFWKGGRGSNFWKSSQHKKTKPVPPDWTIHAGSR